MIKYLQIYIFNLVYRKLRTSNQISTQMIREHQHESRVVLEEDNVNDGLNKLKNTNLALVEDPALGSNTIHPTKFIDNLAIDGQNDVTNKNEKRNKKRNKRKRSEMENEDNDNHNHNNKQQHEFQAEDNFSYNELQHDLSDNFLHNELDYDVNDNHNHNHNKQQDELESEHNLVHTNPGDFSKWSYHLPVGERQQQLSFTISDVTDQYTTTIPSNRNDKQDMECDNEDNEENNKERRIAMKQMERNKMKNRKCSIQKPKPKRRKIAREKNENDEYERRVSDCDYIFEGSFNKTALTLVAVKGRIRNFASYVYICLYLALFLCIFVYFCMYIEFQDQILNAFTMEAKYKAKTADREYHTNIEQQCREFLKDWRRGGLEKMKQVLADDNKRSKRHQGSNLDKVFYPTPCDRYAGFPMSRWIELIITTLMQNNFVDQVAEGTEWKKCKYKSECRKHDMSEFKEVQLNAIKSRYPYHATGISYAGRNQFHLVCGLYSFGADSDHLKGRQLHIVGSKQELWKHLLSNSPHKGRTCYVDFVLLSNIYKYLQIYGNMVKYVLKF